MLLDLVRKLVPIKYRQSVGLRMADQASRSKLSLFPYFFVLCGNIPRNLTLLPGHDCTVEHKGHSIRSPKDGIFSFIEVLQDEVYEMFYRPRLGDTVVDVGAYVGAFTIKASLMVGNKGLIIAIEPASSNIRYLLANTEQLANVKVVQVAVSSFEGERELTISQASPCHSLTDNPNSNTETVRVDTLDGILSKLGVKKVDFIKIDAEGAELEILKGAYNTLRNNKMRLAVASYHNLPTGERELSYVRQELVSAGFRVRIVKGYIYADNCEGES